MQNDEVLSPSPGYRRNHNCHGKLLGNTIETAARDVVDTTGPGGQSSATACTGLRQPLEQYWTVTAYQAGAFETTESWAVCPGRLDNSGMPSS